MKRQKNTEIPDVRTAGTNGGRRHDSFVRIVGMTPDEYKNGGQPLSINYHYASGPFGELLVAATSKGVCYMAFADDPAAALRLLQEKFPNARYRRTTDAIQQKALLIFAPEEGILDDPITLHLKGTDFQLKVWETLLKIPEGEWTTYGRIARMLNRPNASRAAGTAIGRNPVAVLIPCHRVIRSSGELGGYRWGLARKAALIAWEARLLRRGSHRFIENIEGLISTCN